MPGVAEYENQGGFLVPKLPTPDMCAGGGGGGAGGGFSAGGVLTALGAVAGVATIGYFLLK